jgi:hypothetical protein
VVNEKIRDIAARTRASGLPSKIACEERVDGPMNRCETALPANSDSESLRVSDGLLSIPVALADPWSLTDCLRT